MQKYYSKIMQLAPIIRQAMFQALGHQGPRQAKPTLSYSSSLLLGRSGVLAPHEASADTFLPGRGRSPHYALHVATLLAGGDENPSSLLILLRGHLGRSVGCLGIASQMGEV